jgi:hypothetical protein
LRNFYAQKQKGRLLSRPQTDDKVLAIGGDF